MIQKREMCSLILFKYYRVQRRRRRRRCYTRNDGGVIARNYVAVLNSTELLKNLARLSVKKKNQKQTKTVRYYNTSYIIFHFELRSSSSSSPADPGDRYMCSETSCVYTHTRKRAKFRNDIAYTHTHTHTCRLPRLCGSVCTRSRTTQLLSETEGNSPFAFPGAFMIDCFPVVVVVVVVVRAAGGRGDGCWGIGRVPVEEN